MPSSTASSTVTRDGTPQLSRRWDASPERARIVLVHGLGEHSGRYERVGSQFADAGISVRSFDLLGFGASGGPRGHVDSWTTYLDQVEDHVADAGQDGVPVILLGHSMGGLIAFEYALSERPQPSLLVLSSPALGGGAAWQKALAPVMGAIAPRMAVPNALKGEQLSRDPSVGEAYFSDPLVLVKSSAKLGAEIFAAMGRVRTAIGRFDTQAYVVHGGADTIVPASSSAILAELPGVERHLYPKLRHETMNEPEGPEVVAGIVAWIDGKLTSGDRR